MQALRPLLLSTMHRALLTAGPATGQSGLGDLLVNDELSDTSARCPTRLGPGVRYLGWMCNRGHPYDPGAARRQGSVSRMTFNSRPTAATAGLL